MYTKIKFTPSNISHQSGITLVEILVTVLILAIGGLGIASMQLAGLKYTSGSYARTQSVILADDMANRLKSNRTFALDLRPDGSFGNTSPYIIANFGATPTSTSDCIVDECTPAELAEYDLQSWLAEVARVLPAGQGMITIFDQDNPDGIPERQFNISVQWRQVASSSDQDGDEDDEVKSVTYRISI